MPNLEFFHLQLTINEVVLFEFNGAVTQKTIVSVAKAIEAILLEAEEDEVKVRTIFELIVEMMQNILSYSADSVDLGNNTFESKGAIMISHKSDENFYNIHSGNFILEVQKASLLENLEEVNTIPIEDLKEVYKQRRRDRKKVHDRGAGLGFLDIARKSKNKIEYRFHEADEEDRVYFELNVKI